MKYSTLVTNGVKSERDYCKRRIANLKNCNEDCLIAEKVLKDKDIHIWLDDEVNVTWTAKSMREVKDLLRDFGREKIILAENGYYASETCPVWKLKGRNTVIRLSPTWGTEEGATCKLVQVGVEKTERPIYKLICDEKNGD